jgi:Sigma-70, region 4
MDEQDEADHPTETRPVGVEDEDSPQPEVARIRRKVHSAGRDGRVRSKTIAPKRLTRDERRLSELLVYPTDVDRPGTRDGCNGMSRPCPFVSCSHHLYLDVNPETGAIKLNFPHLEVWEMAETCSLDVADRGGITLEEVGAILNLTRERIRQVEVRGLSKIKEDTDGELGIPPERW